MFSVLFEVHPKKKENMVKLALGAKFVVFSSVAI
jgi:hypothetical protein